MTDSEKVQTVLDAALGHLAEAERMLTSLQVPPCLDVGLVTRLVFAAEQARALRKLANRRLSEALATRACDTRGAA